MTKQRSKTIHERYARFFEAPSRTTLRELLLEHFGEPRNCDFKQDWPAGPALAKHLLGIGNAGGGCIVIGVQQNADGTTEARGLSALTDKAKVTDSVRGYLPSVALSALEIGDFAYPPDTPDYPALAGKRFQIIFFHSSSDQVPFVASKSGEGIREGAIYVRHETQTLEATHEEVQRLLGTRLSSTPTTSEGRTLKQHLDELKLLYALIPKTLGPPFANLDQMFRNIVGDNIPHPNYPKENFEAFVHRMIEKKKRLIQRIVSDAS
jgi:hypothetical protein